MLSLPDACFLNHTRALTKLLNQGHDPNVMIYDGSGLPAIHICCKYGHVECLQILLDHGAIYNFLTYDKNTPLMMACNQYQLACVELLLRCPFIDINHLNKGNQSALMRACSFGYHECVQMLLQHSHTQINSYVEYTPLMEACLGNHARIVAMLLLDHRIDVNLQDPLGKSALALACENDSLECVELLSQHPQLDVNSVNRYGKTALYCAIIKGHYECAYVILKHSQIDVNVKNDYSHTVLMTVCRYAAVECLSILLKNPRVDINYQSPSGDTALLICGQVLANNDKCVDRHMKCLKLLWQSPKLNRYIANNKGRNFRHYVQPFMIKTIYPHSYQVFTRLLINSTIYTDIDEISHIV